MKTLLPAVALLLLGGVAFLVRGEHPPSPTQPLRTSAKRAAASVAEEPAAAPKAADAPVARAAGVVPAAPKRAEPKAGLAGFFKAELGLTEEQARGIEGILEDRARAVAGYEAEVHQRGWFRIEDFDHRVGELRGLSYRRIASLLDAEQAARFAALWPERLLAKDCIEISLPDELVVTLD